MTSERALVLVVDDEPVVLSTVAAILSRRGFNVLEAASRQAAVSIAGSHADIRLALLDVGLLQSAHPRLDGWLQSTCPGIRILYSSGSHYGNMSAQGIDAPESDFLQKPFTPVSLLAKVTGMLGPLGKAVHN